MHIDLSVPINEQMPISPGDPATNIKPGGVLENDGYENHYISMGTHTGTHIDAPAHMVKGGKSLHEIPIEHFIGRGRYVRVNNLAFDLETVKQAGIRAGDIVLFHTGMSDDYHNPKYFEDYPALPEDIANFLVESKVKMVGVDMCGPDHDPFPVHQILLSGGVLIIENLANLDKLEGKDFKVYALPLNLEIDGSPARVVAELSSS